MRIVCGNMRMESGKVRSVVGSRCDSSRASDGIKSFTMCALGCFRVVVQEGVKMLCRAGDEYQSKK